MQKKKTSVSFISRLAMMASCAAAVPSCAMVGKMFTPKDMTNYAENPLASGQPLEARKHSDIGQAQEKDCSIWPFEDVVTVTATEAQVCVTMTISKPDDAIFSGKDAPDKQDVRFSAGPQAASDSLQADRKRNQKVGQCNLPGLNKVANVWTAQYQGCTPNNGMLTSASTSLTVAGTQWVFRDKNAVPQKTAAK